MYIILQKRKENEKFEKKLVYDIEMKRKLVQQIRKLKQKRMKIKATDHKK